MGFVDSLDVDPDSERPLFLVRNSSTSFAACSLPFI